MSADPLGQVNNLEEACSGKKHHDRDPTLKVIVCNYTAGEEGLKNSEAETEKWG